MNLSDFQISNITAQLAQLNPDAPDQAQNTQILRNLYQAGLSEQ